MASGSLKSELVEARGCLFSPQHLVWCWLTVLELASEPAPPPLVPPNSPPPSLKNRN